MSKFILALDQGTTSSRALLFGRDGHIAGMCQQEFRQNFPQAGWVEHDPIDIWQTQLGVAQQLLKEQQIRASDIAAIGIANQRETAILWDRQSGTPVHNAIVWQDRRTVDICERLNAEGKAPIVHKKTGLLIDPYFSGTKIKWMLDHVPGLRVRVLRGELAFGTEDSWLIYKLCGEHVTDISNASRTLLFNIESMQWDEELLDMLDIPPSILPKTVPNSCVVRQTKPDLFGESIPISGVAGDQQAATFGQTCFEAGMAMNTYGTGCFMLMNTGSQPAHSNSNLLSTIGWSLGSASPEDTTYLSEGCAFMAGATVQWLRDGLGIIQSTTEVEALAASVTDTGGVVLVPAFAGLGAPYWDPHARGAIFGMSRGTSKAHIARAALASIAYQSADLLHAMQEDSSLQLRELRVDGGASRNVLFMQFQADFIGVPVVRPEITETTALGAAYLAGLAVSFWQSQEELTRHWRMERQFDPMMNQDEREGRMANWHRAIQCARAWT